MHQPKFRTFVVAVAVGLSASLLPMAAASAADDVVEWASTDGESVAVTTTSADQKAHIFFSGTAGRHLLVTCDTQLRSGPTYVLLAADGTQIGAEQTCPNTLRPLDINPLPVTGRYRLLMKPSNGQTFATTTKVLLVDDVHGTMAVGGAPVELKSTRGEQNLVFDFNATAGSRVMVKCKSDGAFPTYWVVGPNGKRVASDIGAFSLCGRSDLEEGPLVDIAETGTYRFVAAQATTSTPRTFNASAAVVAVKADVTAPVLTDGTPLTLTTTSALQRAKATFSLPATVTGGSWLIRETTRPTRSRSGCTASPPR